MKHKNTHKQKKSIFLFLLIGICIVTLSILMVSKISFTPINKIEIVEDTVFNQFNSTTNEYYKMFFVLDDNLLISSIYMLSDNYTSFKLDTKLHLLYENKYYLLENIINGIKQKRVESANSNFIYFMQYSFGLKVDTYAYTFENDINLVKKIYSNDRNFYIEHYLTKIKNKNYIDLNSKILKEDAGASIFIYDISGIDFVISSNNKKYKNTKVEVYNSTNIQGFGATISRLLSNMGYTVAKVQNYDLSLSDTVIYDQINNKQITDDLRHLLNSNKIDTKLPININSVADIIIIIAGDILVLY